MRDAQFLFMKLCRRHLHRGLSEARNERNGQSYNPSQEQITFIRPKIVGL